jgi:hypothetical protein
MFKQPQISNKIFILLAIFALSVGLIFAVNQNPNQPSSEIETIYNPNNPSPITPLNKSSQNKTDQGGLDKNKELEDKSVCIQVITAGKNKVTGEVKDFPSPCDVPEGWEIIDTSY